MEPFDFKKNYVFESDRVLLRPLKQEDYDHLLPYALKEPEIWYFNANGAEGAEKLSVYVDHALRQRALELEYPFVVFDKKSGTYAGSTRFYDIRPDRKTIQLGFTWYGKDHQGTGLNSHCKYLLFQFAFEQLDMLRVGLGANAKNERSIRAMKGVGCRIEGLMRSSGYDAAGERIDSVILSLLQEEWNQEWKEKIKTRCR